MTAPVVIAPRQNVGGLDLAHGATHPRTLECAAKGVLGVNTEISPCA
jgi:hypothetical protein